MRNGLFAVNSFGALFCGENIGAFSTSSLLTGEKRILCPIPHHNPETATWRSVGPLYGVASVIDGIMEILFHGPGLKDLIDKDKDKYIEKDFLKF